MRYRAALVAITFLLLGLIVRVDAEPLQSGRPAEFARSVLSAVRMVNTKHFTPSTEGQLARWAIEGLYEAARVPLPIVTVRRLEGFDRLTEPEKLRLLADARGHLAAPEIFERQQDVAIAIRAMLARLEPGRTPTESTFEEAPTRFGPCFPNQVGVGVGLKLESDPATGMLRVVTPLFGGPAHKAGIRAGDIITHFRVDAEINGTPVVDSIPTKGLTAEAGYRILHGRPGTRVALVVIPRSSQLP